MFRVNKKCSIRFDKKIILQIKSKNLLEKKSAVLAILTRSSNNSNSSSNRAAEI